jgi:hypothetical protein
MTRLTFLLLTSLCCFAADNAFSGIWKLDRAKSTASANYFPPADLTISIEMTTDGIKTTEDYTALTGGEKRHRVRTLKFDGKDYPFDGGTRPSSTDSAKRVDGRTIDFLRKSEGKPVGESRWTISTDGKTLSMKGWNTTPQGERNDYTSVYTHQR